MKAWICVALVLAVAGCGGSVHLVRYTGALPGCGLRAATLSRQADSFIFTPGDGVLEIPGHIAADGSLSGTLNTQPADKPAYRLSVSGHIADEQASIVYATPRCSAPATLARVHPPLL